MELLPNVRQLYHNVSHRSMNHLLSMSTLNGQAAPGSKITRLQAHCLQTKITKLLSVYAELTTGAEDGTKPINSALLYMLLAPLQT